MTDAIEWLSAHWPDILTAVAAVHVAAVAVTRLTPTPADDRWVAKVYDVFVHLGSIASVRPEDKRDGEASN